MADDKKFLRRAIELAEDASIVYSTGGVFGAVIVHEGRIVSEGMNRVVATNDPTWHAEMEAIRMACITLKRFKLSDCVMYTAGEPCPMCLSASYWAGIPKIVYSASVEDAFKYGDFDDKPIFEQLALPASERKIETVQLLRDECVDVWKRYAAKPDRIPY